jgi:hypothetical protein
MVIYLYCTLKPVVCNRDRGVLFEKTEPSLKRENAEMKASEMLFGLPHLPQNNICDVFANLSCETLQNIRLTYVEI